MFCYERLLCLTRQTLKRLICLTDWKHALAVKALELFTVGVGASSIQTECAPLSRKLKVAPPWLRPNWRAKCLRVSSKASMPALCVCLISYTLNVRLHQFPSLQSCEGLGTNFHGWTPLRWFFPGTFSPGRWGKWHSDRMFVVGAVGSNKIK